MSQRAGWKVGWGVGLRSPLETHDEAKLHSQGYMCKGPHAEQPLLCGAAFLCAYPELASFNAYLLPWQVPVGTMDYIRVICIVVIVSIRSIFSLSLVLKL